MNKRITPWIVLLCLLSGAAIYYISTSGSSTFDGDLTNFSVEDAKKRVQTVVLSDVNDNQVKISRNDQGEWLVNGELPARTESVDLLLDALERQTVKLKVGKRMYDKAVRDLKAAGISVEVYGAEDELLNAFVVGGDMQATNPGTIMAVRTEDSLQPYVVHIPGFVGFLSYRYFVSEHDWRTRSIFRVDMEDIQRIEQKNRVAPRQSFNVVQQGAEFTLMHPEGQAVETVNSLKVKKYVGKISRLNYEKHLSGFSSERLDSLRKAVPFCTIAVTNKAGETQTLSLYRRPIQQGSKRVIQDETDPTRQYDGDAYYGLHSTEPTTVWTVQDFALKGILQPRSDFKLNSAATAGN